MIDWFDDEAAEIAEGENLANLDLRGAAGVDSVGAVAGVVNLTLDEDEDVTVVVGF